MTLKDLRAFVIGIDTYGVANPDPVRYNPTGNITGVPRTIKATMGFRF